MDLAELRFATLDWLDNPSGDQFVVGGDHRRLDHLINTAYEDAVGHVEKTAKAYNVAGDPISLTVTSAAREYPVPSFVDAPADADGAYGSGGVRKIISATPLDSSGCEGLPLNMIPYTDRNRTSAAGGQPHADFLSGFNTTAGGLIYVYRRSDARWVLGFCAQQPADQTVRVYYAPDVTRLTAATQIPYQVPPNWHEVIAIGAAIAGAIQTSRDHVRLDGLYAHKLSLMAADLAQLTHRMKARPL